MALRVDNDGHRPRVGVVRPKLLGVVIVCLTLGLSCTGSETRPRNVVLVILDTVRADHFSCYGYSRLTTPNLDRLAAEGERYDRAFSQSSWTMPAVTTILTGQPPHVHGAYKAKDGWFPLRDDVVTLAERMGRAGYDTGAVINVMWLQPLFKMNRGFETYDFHMTDETNRSDRPAAATTTAALDWVHRVRPGPFFLVVHYFDPHLTYDPPTPYDTMHEPDTEGRLPRGFGSAGQVVEIRDGRVRLDNRSRKSLVARYDGELTYLDAQFGRLREGLERQGVWDDSLVIVVGDHGEEFWDHGGFEHGHTHYRELLRVPLLVRRPGHPAGVVHDGRVRQIDIAPTILDFAGLEALPELPGRVLGAGGAEYSVAEGSFWGGDLVSIRSDAGTLILNRDSGEQQFFAAADVVEIAPLPEGSPGRADLERLLLALPPEKRRDRPPWTPDEEQLEQLRALGYVE